MNRNTILFYRVSSDRQEWERQQLTLKTYCKTNNYIECDYVAAKISGLSELESRAELNELLDKIKLHDAKFVIVDELSRLGRTINLINYIKKLAEIKVNVIVIKEGLQSLNNEGVITPTTEFIMKMISAGNDMEVSTTKYRLASGRINKVKNHNVSYLGGEVAFGYKLEKINEKNSRLVINEDEAPIIKEMFERFINGEGTNRLVKWLNDNNIKPRNGLQFSTQTVRYMLKNRLYTGEFTFGKTSKQNTEKVTIKIPAIIDLDTFEKANEKYKHTRKGKHLVNNYLLNSGLVVCGICGKHYFATVNKKQGTNIYSCATKKYKNLTSADCGNNSINIDKLNKIVLYTVLYNNEAKQLIEAELKKNGVTPKILIIDKKIEDINKAFNVINGKEKRATEGYLKELISGDELKQIKSDLNQEKEQLNLYLNDLNVEKRGLEKARKEQKSLFELFTKKENTNLIKENINNIITRIVITKQPLWNNRKNKLDTLTKVSIFTSNNANSIDCYVTRYSSIIYYKFDPENKDLFIDDEKNYVDLSHFFKEKENEKETN